MLSARVLTNASFEPATTKCEIGRDAAARLEIPWRNETPIKEVLQLLKKEKWPIYGDIELEYKIPAGSTSVAEVAKCVAYCREALA